MYHYKSDAFHARAYQWLTDTDPSTFKGFCPYFWRWLFILAVFPIVLFMAILRKTITYFVSRYVDRKYDEYVNSGAYREQTYEEYAKRGSISKENYLVYSLLFIGVFIFIGPFFPNFSEVLFGVQKFIQAAMIALTASVIGGVAFLLIVSIVLTTLAFLFDKVPFFRTVKEVVSVFYEKNCPMLKWD